MGPLAKGDPFKKTAMINGPKHKQNNEAEANARNKTIKTTETNCHHQEKAGQAL